MMELILAIFTIIILGIASWIDLKTREVPDYLSYVLISGGLILRLILALYTDNYKELIWLPISLVIIFTFSYFMYSSGQWGGGDVKIMTGLAIIMSYRANNNFFPFFADFFINMLIVGTIYGIIMMSIKAIKNFKEFKEELSKLDLILLIILIIVITLIVNWFRNLPSIMILMLFALLGSFSLKYLRIIEKKLMKENIPVTKLTEGDWITENIKLNGKVVIPKRKIGITLEDLNFIKKNFKKFSKMKVQVKVGIPFVPTFFLAYVTTLILGNLLYKILILSI